MRKELIHMSAVEAAIQEMIQMSPNSVTKREAKKILKECGILDQNENIQAAYSDIIVKTGMTEDGRKV